MTKTIRFVTIVGAALLVPPTWTVAQEAGTPEAARAIARSRARLSRAEALGDFSHGDPALRGASEADVRMHRENAARPQPRAKKVVRRIEATTPSPVAVAKSRIQIATKLIKGGKKDQARDWLDRVVAMKADVATVQEARQLLAKLPTPRR